MCAFTPSFEDFLDYFYNFGAVKDSIRDISMFTGILICTLVYELYLTDTVLKRLMLTAILARMVNSLLSLLLAFGITLGIGQTTYACL
jgi:hypothetical protein